MSAIHDEKTKLPAPPVDNVAGAFAVIGFVTPITAISFGVASAPSLHPATAFFVAIWLCAAISLHWVGRRVLRSIRR